MRFEEERISGSITLSVIIPSYNAESTIERCVQSILSNNGVSMEIILVNDGSSDRTGSICDAIALSDKRVKVIHQPNGGVGKARNTGIEASVGEYLTFVDSDDTVAPDMYQQMLAAAQMHRTDCVMCGVVNVFSRHVEHTSHAFGNQVIRGGENVRERVLVPLMTSGHPHEALLASVWNKIYRAEKVRNKNLRFSHLPRAEDWLFNVAFFKDAESVTFLQESLYHYDRSSEGSLSKTWNADSFDNSLWIQSRLATLFPERFTEQSLLLGILNMQVNDLRLYATSFGIRGFSAYAQSLFFHEQLRNAYREIETLPSKFRFPGMCLRKERKTLYVLWCHLIGWKGFIKSALRPLYRGVRRLLQR